MNKNFKIIQINGLSGLLILGFIVAGLFCGFVIFPIWAIMNAWNSIVGDLYRGPVINYLQALLLWLALALIFFLTLKNSISIKIQREEGIDIDIKDIIGEVKESHPDESDRIIDIEKEETRK